MAENSPTKREPHITIRKGSPEDAEAFVNLISLAYTPLFRALYGIKTGDPLKNLFCLKKNYLSFEHSLFAEVDGEIAGVIMGFDWRTRQQEQMRTRLLKFRYFGGSFWLKVPYLLVNSYVPGLVDEGEYYIGHLVVYPQFRGMGLGKKLIAKEEDIARKMGAQRMVADVKVTNEVIIRLVKEMGYTVSEDVKEMVVGRDRFHFHRITKDLRN